MASANSTDCSNGSSSSSVPQWKRDLIQRRRQQNKVLASNGASVKLCSAVSGALSSSSTSVFGVDNEPVERLCITEDNHGVVASCVLTSRSRTTEDTSCECAGSSAVNRSTQQTASSPCKSCCQPSCGATCCGEASSAVLPCGERSNERRASGADLEHHQSVARNMRLEADVTSLLLRTDDSSRNNNSSILDSVDFENHENTDENVVTMRNYENGLATRIIRRMDEKTNVRVYPSEQTRKQRSRNESLGDANKSSNGKMPVDAECESDSSEELQYGPGIVNRLKSKYLNLTLRETNKSRVAVQRFRRAASLEDLLDCEHEDERNGEKTSRKYAKRTSPSGTVKCERYRNPSRGNESMKRARSVEALMRYNAPLANEENCQERLAALRREPVNDHIVLIDRTSVKIESRLGEPDTTRPKAVNKPKRIKPLLAETERPPPDLVKTTMRLFEGSVKKLKPKGDVAVKVATFKTINDSYKAQSIKKVLPKPPVQPKPFVNGNNVAKLPSSPKKIILASKPTAEVIESADQEEHRREGVVTEPIVQSVSSVVSKFQRIEKSYTPTTSPEPNYKLKFSPSPSPEPHATSKLGKSSTPPPSSSSPRISSPGVAPTSPKRDSPRLQPACPPGSPNGENLGRTTLPEVPAAIAAPSEQDAKDCSPIRSAEDAKRDNEAESKESTGNETINRLDEEARSPIIAKPDIPIESCVDGSRAISKIALDNISKAGITMQYNFGDKSSTEKTYLPGCVATHNGQKSERQERPMSENGETSNESDAIMASPVPLDTSSCSSPISLDSINDEAEAANEKSSAVENNRESRIPERNLSPEQPAKPIGAISSLALAKSSPVCPTNASQHSNPINEVSGKTTTKHPKYDASPPQKQIGIIRPLVSTKTQQIPQNLSNRELEKNLINRVKSIEQPTKVVVSLKSADEIQPVKKSTGSPGGGGGGGGGGLWDTKHWNSPNNTMVFNFSNRKDVPDYIENDGLIIRRKREKQKVGDGGVIVLDSTVDTASSDDTDWEISGGPPSPCDVSFVNDNVLINGRSNLSKQPRNHKHRIQFDDGATRTFEYPSEASILADEGTSVDGDSSSTCQQSSQGAANKSNSTSSTMSSTLLGGGGLASFTPSKVDLASEGFELGVTRSAVPAPPTTVPTSAQTQENEEYLKSDEDAAAWGAEATADLLY